MRMSACGRMIVRKARHAERQRRAHLPRAHGEQARADHLADIGAEMEAEREHARGGRRQADAGEEGEGEIGPDQEDQDRDGPNGVDIKAEHAVEPAASVGPPRPDQEPDRRAEQD
jgi:hypothetical protein